MKKLIPVFAMALAVLAAFAFTTNGDSEEVSQLGVYDSNSNGICNIPYDCGPVGPDFCFVKGVTPITPVFEKTDCAVQLRTVLYD